MTIKAGDRMPEGTFTIMANGEIKALSSRDFFAGKGVVLFAVPGAFTPTCSADHLPGFVKHAEAIKGRGIDQIACLSVNDVFVMEAWRKSQQADPILMLADGNGDYTRALGLELDGRGFNMGIRSQRYALIVDDGLVRAAYVDAPGEFRVSSAEAVLAALA